METSCEHVNCSSAPCRSASRTRSRLRSARKKALPAEPRDAELAALLEQVGRLLLQIGDHDRARTQFRALGGNPPIASRSRPGDHQGGRLRNDGASQLEQRLLESRSTQGKSDAAGAQHVRRVRRPNGPILGHWRSRARFEGVQTPKHDAWFRCSSSVCHGTFPHNQ